MKTILVTIQIDEVKAADLAEIEEALEEALAAFKRKRVTYTLNDTFGPMLPIQEQTVN